MAFTDYGTAGGTLPHGGWGLKNPLLVVFREIVSTFDILQYSRELSDSEANYVSEYVNDVDAYLVFVENSSDVAQASLGFKRHDRQVVSHHFHAAKWSIRKGGANRQCQ